MKHKLIIDADNALREVGEKHSLKILKQIEKNIIQLRKTYPQIKALLMGMGSWCLSGDNILAIYDDGESGNIEMGDLLEYGSQHRFYSKPKGWTKTHEKLVDEINGLCEFLTVNDSMSVSDLKFD